MKYPISVEEYIAAMRRVFKYPDPEVCATMEEIHREIIPVVNDAYKDGLEGKDGYPLNVDAEMEAFSDAKNIPIERVKDNAIILWMIGWINKAYAAGLAYRLIRHSGHDK